MKETGISNVVVIFKPDKFSILKESLKGVGILGMTVTHVEGCGLQGGRIEHYRGAEIEVDLLPKTKVEIIVPEEKVNEVVLAVKSVLKTGKMGDGKIFIYDVGQIIRISNDAEGFDALEIKK